MTSDETETGVAKKPPYPKSIIFIVGNEFCERFSYYGMRTILVLYFRYILGYSENLATQTYHIFAMACYFTPVLGAIIADSLLGKFWTILSISVVYAAGNVMLSFASMHGTIVLTFLGLGLIALGTGGIKPCVAAFGGDQFKPEQQKELQQFFSLFYVSINAGSLISTFLTPILRQDVSCMNRSDCYPLAFGVPAVLMVLALALFIVGRFATDYVMVPPQKDNVVIMVCKCVGHALARKFFSKAPKKSHWLEYSDDRYDSNTINDVKALMKVLFLYLPLPIFWALFDQQGSRWTLQATRMNGQLGSFIIKPDQIQVVNPMLIILMIPLFEYGVYPVLKKFNLGRPLQRMTIGGALAGIAFIICGFMQLQLESEQPVKPLEGHNHMALVNSLAECEVEFYNKAVPSLGAAYWANVDRTVLSTFNQQFKILANGSSCREGTFQVTESFSLDDEKSIILVVTENIYNSKIDYDITSNFLSKPDEGGALFFTVFNLKNYNNDTFQVTESNDHLTWNYTTVGDTSFGHVDKFEVEIKGRDVVMSVGTEGKKKEKELHLDQGATYIQLINGDMNGAVDFTVTNVVDKNQMSVFLQLIQYVIITCAEIMFSVTGLEFSYAQAPKSMKAVLQACWLLTVAFGNLIIAIIADAQIFPEQSHEFFFFGGLMIVDMALFAVMAYYYVPSNVAQDEDNDEEPVKEREDNLPQKLNGTKEKGNWED